jgi:hypothetical protein
VFPADRAVWSNSSESRPLFKTFGVITPDSPWPVNNIGTQALAPLIGIDHPPPEPMPTLPS